MDKVQKIREGIESLRKHYIEREDFDIGWNYALDKILSLLDTFEDEPVSEELEEAAKKYGTKKHPVTKIGANESAYDFKAGANWQKAKDQETIELAEDHAMLAGMEKMKEQMLKDSVGGFVIEDIEEGNGDFLLSADYLPKERGFKDRQKVKVIVIKED